MNKIFKINYSQHPAYKGIKVGIIEKILYQFIFFQALLRVFLSYITAKKIPIFDTNELKNQKTPKNLKKFLDNGFVQISETNLTNFLKRKLEPYIKKTEDKVNKIPPAVRNFSDCITGYEFNKNSTLFKEIEEEITSYISINSVLIKYFKGVYPKLVYFQIHINQANDEYVFKHSDFDSFDDEVNFFHVDTNLNTLKAMIYLTEVNDEKDGAFEYVLGSHKLFNAQDFVKRKVLRKIGAYRRDNIGKKIILSIPESYRVKNEFSDFSKNSELGTLITNEKVTCTGKSNIILFNPHGIHRGGRVRKGKRIAIQLVFCPDNSWKTG